MKIFFDNVQWGSLTGPNTFAKRLADELLSRGHVLADRDDYDVALAFIEPRSLDLKKPWVQRLDGIWFKPNEFYTKNVSIKAAYERADAVIFQSEFDRNMVEHWWNTRDHSHVILNGAQENTLEVTSEALISLRERFEKIFVCSANWHPQKRLNTNMDVFHHILHNISADSCIIVMGSNPDVIVKNPRVMYTNSVPYEIYMQVYKVADCMIHCAWLDHSPNTVVESLVSGCPVLCTSEGGTRELVGNFGTVLSDRETYSYSLVDYDQPPSVDVSQLKSLPNKMSLVRDVDVSIKRCADQYESVLESLLERVK